MRIREGQVRSATDETPFVGCARRYLERHYAEKVSLVDLARLCGTSAGHLNHVFSQEVGQPPRAFQNAVRVRKAAQLLLRGLPVKQVATEVGFHDQSHFARHFKRVMGLPPALYIERTRTTKRSED